MVMPCLTGAPKNHVQTQITQKQTVPSAPSVPEETDKDANVSIGSPSRPLRLSGSIESLTAKTPSTQRFYYV
jgi:hypothetical protein